MFSNYLKTIEGITTYPLISLVIFLVFFVGVLVYVLRMKKEDEDKMSRLPLN